jgi:hypothetical protein
MINKYCLISIQYIGGHKPRPIKEFWSLNSKEFVATRK